MTFDANIQRLPGQRQRQCQGREENPTSEARADFLVSGVFYHPHVLHEDSRVL